APRLVDLVFHVLKEQVVHREAPHALVDGMIWRNVRLIRSPTSCSVLGTPCSQKCWQVPPITSRLPWARGNVSFSRLVLCLRMKCRTAPNDTEATTGFGPSSGSASVWKPMESRPSRYRFSNRLLNAAPDASSTRRRMALSVGVHSTA